MGVPGVDRRAIEQTRVCVEIDAMREHAERPMYGSSDTLYKRIYRRRRHRFNSRTVPNLEEPQQVVVLAVGIAAYVQRRM